MSTRDIIIRGIIVGLLADAVKLLANYIAFSINLTEVVFWQLVSANFLPEEFLLTPAALFIGGVADLTITSFLGILFVTFVVYLGKEHLWTKGIGFGMLMWVVLFGTILGPQIEAKIPQDPAGVIVTIVAHFVFGLGLALFTLLIDPKRAEHDAA